MFGFTSFAAAPFADLGVNPNASVEVTGVSATGSIGTSTVTLLTLVTLTGVDATGSTGTPTITGTAPVTLTGVDATGSIGTPTVTGIA